MFTAKTERVAQRVETRAPAPVGERDVRVGREGHVFHQSIVYATCEPAYAAKIRYGSPFVPDLMKNLGQRKTAQQFVERTTRFDCEPQCGFLFLMRFDDVASKHREP